MNHSVRVAIYCVNNKASFIVQGQASCSWLAGYFIAQHIITAILSFERTIKAGYEAILANGATVLCLLWFSFDSTTLLAHADGCCNVTLILPTATQ